MDCIRPVRCALRYFQRLQVEFHMLTIILYSLKNASPQKQEAARIEVENAEDDLVQKTEVAITLMKTVLDNVRQSY